MCSFVLKVLFLGGLLAGVTLTAVALATSYWQVTSVVGQDVAHIGLFKDCLGGKERDVGCRDVDWKDMPAWRQAVVALLGVALLISLFAIGWWFLACIGCCCQNFLTPPLPVLALLLLLLDAAAVIVYASYASADTSGQSKLGGVVYGYSFWCAVAAVCGFALTMFIGCGTVAMAKTGRDRTAYRTI